MHYMVCSTSKSNNEYSDLWINDKSYFEIINSDLKLI